MNVLVEGLFPFENNAQCHLDIDHYTPSRYEVLIQDIHLYEKPFIRSDWNRNGHLILSYAFSKSSLRIIPFCFFDEVHVLFRVESPPLQEYFDPSKKHFESG